MEPGLYTDVPDEEYRAWPYPSYSTLKHFRDDSMCEEEIKFAIDNPPDPSEAMRLGTMVELAIDDPDSFCKNVLPLPPEIKVRRGSAWQELQKANPDITYLPSSEYKKHKDSLQQARDMAESVRNCELAAKLINKAERQVSFVCDLEFADAMGELVKHRVKGRCDYLNRSAGIVPDLKTSTFGGQRSVGIQIWKLGYDIQSALYTDCVSLLLNKPIRFYFIFVRSVKPYVVTVYNAHNTSEMAGNLLAIGRGWYQIALERYANCVRTGVWRGYFSPDNEESRVLDPILPGYAS
jgi:hypothetical protein